jgi:HPt (histidine-containing phosphotransfer) domain-containing protein
MAGSVGIGASLRRLLIEPHPLLTDPVERRRARLLAVLQLTEMVQFLGSALIVSASERGALGALGPRVLGGAAIGVGVSYALVRTRHVRFSLALFVCAHLLTVVALPIFVGPTPDLSPLLLLAFLSLPMLLVNAFSNTRATLLTGVAGIGMSACVMLTIGTTSWHAPVRQGLVLSVTLLVLIIVLGLHRDRVEADRAAELRARNEELEALRSTLEHRVEERTAALSKRNREMQLILDHTAQGLLTVDLSGVVTSEPSAALVRWFGRPTEGETFFRYLSRRAGQFAQSAEIAWDQVTSGILPLEVALDQVPSKLAADGRHYCISFEPIVIAESAEPSFLVVVSDVSALVEREELARERRETFALFEHLMKDRSAIVDFLDSSSLLVKRILAPNPGHTGFARDVHTLKGDSLTLGLESLGQFCHELESQMADRGAPPDASGLAQIWTRLEVDINRLLGNGRQTIEISRDQQEALEQAVRSRMSHEELLGLVSTLKLDNVEPRLLRLSDSARQIANRLGKSIDVNVSASSVRVTGGKWSPLWAALVHAVRNAVDHGLESPEERIQAGKNATGQLWLRAFADDSEISIEVEDDGRGIDWEAVRARALAAGVVAGDSADLVSALFMDGVSTASELTEISGRGVGMGALRASVTELGGRLSVSTSQKRGTLLRMVFPQPHPTRLPKTELCA